MEEFDNIARSRKLFMEWKNKTPEELGFYYIYPAPDWRTYFLPSEAEREMLDKKLAFLHRLKSRALLFAQLLPAILTLTILSMFATKAVFPICAVAVLILNVAFLIKYGYKAIKYDQKIGSEYERLSPDFQFYPLF